MANVSHEGISYGKPSPGRNPIAELPQGEIIPYGKPSPGRNPMAELPPLWQISVYWDSMCDFCLGGGEEIP